MAEVRFSGPNDANPLTYGEWWAAHSMVNEIFRPQGLRPDDQIVTQAKSSFRARNRKARQMGASFGALGEQHDYADRLHALLASPPSQKREVSLSSGGRPTLSMESVFDHLVAARIPYPGKAGIARSTDALSRGSRFGRGKISDGFYFPSRPAA